jgi:hypothetical protein
MVYHHLDESFKLTLDTSCRFELAEISMQSFGALSQLIVKETGLWAFNFIFLLDLIYCAKKICLSHLKFKYLNQRNGQQNAPVVIIIDCYVVRISFLCGFF